MRKPSARLEYSAHRFVVRRIESALLCGDADPAQRPARGRALLAGCLLAAVVLAASAMLGVLRPQAGLGNAPIMVAQPSGALYVRVGDTVHPVLNLASARLIARTAANPSPVREAALAGAKRGPLLGIPGAPQEIGEPLPADQSAWTLCDSAEVTTVIVGPVDAAARRLAPDQAVLVSATGPDPGATTHLLYQDRRAVANLADPAVARALRLKGHTPRRISRLLLTAIPEVPPIAAPLIPGADSAVVNTLPVTTFPVPVSLDDSTAMCMTWLPGQSSPADVSLLAAADLPVPAGQAPVLLAQADRDGPALDAVYLPPGRSAYVRSAGRSGTGGPEYLIADTGVRFAVGDDDAATDLGMPVSAVPAPWPLLAALPDGPELTRANASIARDTVTPNTGPNSP